MSPSCNGLLCRAWKKCWGQGKGYSSLKCLLCKQEDLILISRIHVEKQVWYFLPVFLMLQRQRQIEPWGLLGSQANAKSSEKWRDWMRKKLNINLWLTHVHTHKESHTLKCTHVHTCAHTQEYKNLHRQKEKITRKVYLEILFLKYLFI